MWSFFQSHLTRYFGRTLPVSSRIAVSPGWIDSVRLPQLVPQIDSDDSFVVSVSLCQLFGAIEEHILRVLSRPPEPVAIIIGAAPLRSAGVVIKDDH